MTSINQVRIFAVLAIALMLGLSAPSSASLVKISSNSKTPARIVCGKSVVASQMGDYLRKFLTDRFSAVAPGTKARVWQGYAAPQFVLATQSDCAAVKAGVSIPKFAADAREDAYILDVRKKSNGVIVLLIGKSAAGIRSAVARFTCKVANDGKSLWIDSGREMNDPFIRMRTIIAGNSARRQTPFGSPFKDCDIETWSLERIRAYPEMFWQFGFNALQCGQNRGYGSVPDKELPRINKAKQELFRGSKDFGMYNIMFMWGDCLFDENVTLSWNNHNEQRIMRLYQKDLAEDYAPLVDHIVVHIGDPGGCTRDGCDYYKTPQQLTAAYLEAFRRVNPRIQGTLSTWANSSFWKKSPKKLDMSNYAPMFPSMASQTEYAEPIPDGAKFLDDTFMPSDVGIALNRYFNAEQAKMVASYGRPVDIWGWYICDNEMINTYWIQMQHANEILSRMPDEARNLARWQAIELCFHGWPQVIDSYVGAQKLWNPRRPLEEIEREFCIAGFGPMNADAMFDLYKACETGWCEPIPRPSDFGTSAHIDRLCAIIAKADTVKFPKGWKSNFAFPVPVQKYVDMLKARARLILAVSKAKQKIDAAGDDAEAIKQIKQEAIKTLPNLPIDPLFKQDPSIVVPGYNYPTFADMIEKL